MLDSMGFEPQTVLDLYAGTGALGIEALSRGARQADFVEQSGSACAVLRENLTLTGFSNRSRLFCLAVQRSVTRLSGPYDLIFVDPPYGDQTAERTLETTAGRSLSGKETILVYEHSRRDEPPVRLGDLGLTRTRSHGSSSVSFYKMLGSEAAFGSEAAY